MKPMIFSTPMVRAILDGKKTQTRRVIKPQPDGEIKANIPYEFYGTKTERIFTDTKAYLAPCSVGDILWVRETWGVPISLAGDIIYKADFVDRKAPLADGEKWRPSIFMPREAARIFLRVKNVRVERLQEITEEDARAEGVKPIRSALGQIYVQDDHSIGYRLAFEELWNEINAKRGYGWDTNPWVWVIEFERINKE